MTFERGIARLFCLDDAAWQRHANPLSVLLRFTVLPLLVLSFWSRAYLGWWACIPVALSLLWTWLNPRIFPPPASFDHWTSQAVLGERVWLNRDRVPVPPCHRTVPHILSVISGLGMLGVAWGVLSFDPAPLFIGIAVVYLGKLWFLDRMVWIWQDMKDATGEYRSWARGAPPSP